MEEIKKFHKSEEFSQKDYLRNRQTYEKRKNDNTWNQFKNILFPK